MLLFIIVFFVLLIPFIIYIIEISKKYGIIRQLLSNYVIISLRYLIPFILHLTRFIFIGSLSYTVFITFKKNTNENLPNKFLFIFKEIVFILFYYSSKSLNENVLFFANNPK